MSSSNQVRVTSIAETVYGVTPGAGNFDTARFTSENLSGTPETVESQQIRTDRMSSGQIVTGLTVSGDINGELAKDLVIDGYIESAMYSTWTSDTPVAVDLTIATGAKTLTRASGDWNVDVAIGDIISLSSFANSVNNTQVAVTGINSATVITYGGPTTLVDEAGVGTSFVVSDLIDIGVTKKSYSFEKAFLDLTTKALIYKGMIANQMNLNFSHGEVATIGFSWMGNSYTEATAAGDFITNGRTINAAATSNSMNGSIDMPFVISSAAGVLDEVTFCLQSVQLTLNNNLTPQTCVGNIAPINFNEGTCNIEVNLSVYLADNSWSVIAKKLAQTEFGLGFQVKNSGGYYGVYLPALQVSFDDPSSAGQNQQVILNMRGVAKVGANGESAIRIFKSI